MAYSAFNSQGPQVSVSLFGNAATQGVNIGKSIPSVASSIISGVKEGLDYSQSYESKEIQNENNQAIADYNQVKAANADETIALDIERTRLLNEQAQLNLELEQTDRATDVELKQVENKGRLLEANNKYKYAAQVNAITDIMNSGDPDAIANSFIDPRYTMYWSDKDNKEARNQGILANMNRYQGDQKKIAENIVYADLDEQIRKTQAAAIIKGEGNETPLEKTYREAFNNLADVRSLFDSAPTAADRVNLFTKGVMVNSNAYEVDPDTKALKPVLGYEAGGKDATYDLIVDGKVALKNLPKEVFKNYNIASEAFQAQSDVNAMLYQKDAPARNVFAPKEAVQTPSDTLKVPVIEQKRQELQAKKDALVNGTQPSTPPVSNSNSVSDLAEKGIEALKKGADAIFGVPEAKANDMQAYMNTAQPVDETQIKPLYNVADLPKEERKIITQAKSVLNKIDKLPVVLKNQSKIEKIVPNIPGVAGVDLVKAIAAVESGGNVNATSSTGVKGIMQLTSAAAQEVGVTNRFDPDQNLLGGAAYISQMLRQFDGNLEHALLAYNGGPGLIREAISNVGEATEDIVDYISRKARRNKNTKRYPSMDKAEEIAAYPEKIGTYLAALKYGSDEVIG